MTCSEFLIPIPVSCTGEFTQSLSEQHTDTGTRLHYHTVIFVELASSVESRVRHGAPHFPWVLLFLSCEIYYSPLV